MAQDLAMTEREKEWMMVQIGVMFKFLYMYYCEYTHLIQMIQKVSNKQFQSSKALEPLYMLQFGHIRFTCFHESI